MTLDEAFAAASRLLDQRGQLMNAHLFRLVEGDENLFRDVRDRLIVNGIAADRSGVGLVRSTPKNHCVAEIHANQTQVASAAAQTIEEIASPSQIAILESGPVQPDDWSEAQWWVMKRGVRGPVNLIELCHLRQSGEIEASDVVRQGLQGLWLQVDEVPLLATAKPATRNDSIGGLGRRLVPASRRSALQIVPVNIDSPADTITAQRFRGRSAVLFHRTNPGTLIDMRGPVGLGISGNRLRGMSVGHGVC